MSKTITLLLQLSLIIPFVMVITAALSRYRDLKSNPRWPAFIGISLTVIVALTSTIFFSPTIRSQSYSQTLTEWLSLSSDPGTTLQIGVLFDFLSLSFFTIVSIASLFYLVLNESFTIPQTPYSNSNKGYTSLLYLMCFFATVGSILSTNFLQLLLFWFMLSMSMNLLHEVNFESNASSENRSRHWWGWNALSDGMLLMAVFLIGSNFQSWSFLQCLRIDAIQAVHAKNSAALPGIGAALFFAALPRLGLFPASMLMISQQSPWKPSSLAALNLLALPTGLFLLLRCVPILLAVSANQMLMVQVGTVSALLTMVSACSLTEGQQRDRFLCWISSTLASAVVVIIGINATNSLSLIRAMILLFTCVMAVLIPIAVRLQTRHFHSELLSSIKVCYLLLMIAILAGLILMLNPLITARTLTDHFLIQIMVWLMLLISFGAIFGLARFYFSLNLPAEPRDSPPKVFMLPLYGMTLFICLSSICILLQAPFLQSIWPGLLSDSNANPFDRDWLFCSLFGLTIMLSTILAWMRSPKISHSQPMSKNGTALINLGQSHFYSLRILKQALINPLTILARVISLLDQWLFNRFSRASIEQTPRYWGQLLKQMQNGQVTFETLVLLFTLSILIIVLLVLQI